MRVGGIVLCGGQSSRMGTPKAWLPFAGELMLPRVVRVLSEAVAPIVVVAAPQQELPPLPSYVDIVRDAEEGLGPLQGLATGLAALRDRAEAAYLSSCDVPFLRSAFVRRMIDLIGEAEACVPRTDSHFHPLAAVYRLEVDHAARRLLATNRRQISLLVEKVPTRIVEPLELADVDADLQSLRNLNTPADYEAALRDMTGL
jgi:molybdopterin-guanine dinucleotide biosynthesis protein A